MMSLKFPATPAKDDVVISFKHSTDQITLLDEFVWLNSGIESVRLTQGGVTYGLTDIANAAIAAEATSGNDAIVGIDGVNDVIDGGKGNDLITGGRANDTYMYRAGDGDDIIDPTRGGTDQLKLVDYNIGECVGRQLGSRADLQDRRRSCHPP